jgi:diacylglycerol diphosphate phosphatase/phosphatidate phosphatase
VSFAGLGFFSFYLAGKMHLFDQRGKTVRDFSELFRIINDEFSSKLKGWLSVAPFAAAALVAISRTMDYRRSCSISAL